MNIRGRIVRLERRRRRGIVDWTDCPDPCHLPPDPTEVRVIDYRMGLRPFMPPEMRHLVPPEPTCPTCGEPPGGIYVVTRDLGAGATWDDTSDDDTPGVA